MAVPNLVQPKQKTAYVIVLRPSTNYNQITGSKKYDPLDRYTQADPLRSLQMEHDC